MNSHISKLIFLLIFISSPVFSQDAILSQFYASPLYLNPAFAGSGKNTRLVCSYRNHPIPEATNFSFISAAIDGFHPQWGSGLGLIVTSDYQGGLAWNYGINAAYAYHLRISNSWNINFGLQAGLLGSYLNWNNLQFSNPSQSPPDSRFGYVPDFASGILIYNQSFYGGFASHHLTSPKYGLYEDSPVLPKKYTAHAGFIIEPRKNRRANTLLFDYFISPNIIYQNQGSFNRINYGLYAGVEKIMAGVWYRQDFKTPGVIIFVIGLNQEKFRIGYSFDYALSGYTDITHSVHELSIAFDLISDKEQKRRKVLMGVGF
jgi:type IX secretion system PorP/SprF family membrane protein